MQLESSGENKPEELPLFQIGARSSHPITVEIMVNDKMLEMELDTGAAVSIISEEARQKLFSGVSLQKSPVVQQTYTGEPMEVKGQLMVRVRYGAQEHTLPLTVIAGDGPTLLGRDWLQRVQLNWKSIGLAALDHGNDRVQGLLQKYKEVFRDELGTMSYFKAPSAFVVMPSQFSANPVQFPSHSRRPWGRNMIA